MNEVTISVQMEIQDNLHIEYFGSVFLGRDYDKSEMRESYRFVDSNAPSMFDLIRYVLCKYTEGPLSSSGLCKFRELIIQNKMDIVFCNGYITTIRFPFKDIVHLIELPIFHEHNGVMYFNYDRTRDFPKDYDSCFCTTHISIPSVYIEEMMSHTGWKRAEND